MQTEDLVFAAECTAAEDWVSENRITLEGFFIKDTQGCFLAEEDNHRVGICMALYYGASGFICELIVRQEARGRGVGAALLNHSVGYLKERGVESVYLDGVVKAVRLYERNGFHKICRSWRFSGYLTGNKSPQVRPMAANDLDQVYTLDKFAFGADRSFYLRRRLEIYPKLCHVMTAGDTVTGFIQGREGNDWVSAGPWVVENMDENPLELLNALAAEAGDRQISIGILETNQRAYNMVQSLGFKARVDSPWRMALGSSSDLGTSTRCYAIGSAATG